MGRGRRQYLYETIFENTPQSQRSLFVDRNLEN